MHAEQQHGCPAGENFRPGRPCKDAEGQRCRWNALRAGCSHGRDDNVSGRSNGEEPRMARKPKIPPSPDDAAVVQVPEPAAPDEAAVSARRGCKARAAALSLASPAAADVGRPAPDAAGANAPAAGPTKAPGRKGPGRKPKQAADAETAPSIQDGAGAPRDQAPGQPEAEASLDLTGDGAQVAAAASQAETAAGSDPVQPDRDPVSPASEAAQPAPEAEASAPQSRRRIETRRRTGCGSTGPRSSGLPRRAVRTRRWPSCWSRPG